MRCSMLKKSVLLSMLLIAAASSFAGDYPKKVGCSNNAACNGNPNGNYQLTCTCSKGAYSTVGCTNSKCDCDAICK